MDKAVIKIPRYGLLLALVALPGNLLAHQLDEYLQSTLVSIEPGEIRLQMNFTPGVAVAEQVLDLIDWNFDGVISTNEAAAYAELVKCDLNVQLDGRKVDLKAVSFNFPEPVNLRTGWGIIQVEYSASTGSFTAGSHKLSVSNRHFTAVSVYLLNAAKPKSALVKITEQKRNESQSTGEISFEVNSPKKALRAAGTELSFTARLSFCSRTCGPPTRIRGTR